MKVPHFEGHYVSSAVLKYLHFPQKKNSEVHSTKYIREMQECNYLEFRFFLVFYESKTKRLLV